MVDIKKLLETRKRLKQRKPFFLRQDKKRKKRVKGKWRRPHGLQSKIREKRKGHINPPSTGYGAPRAVHGRDAAGRIPLVAATMKDIERATKDHVVIIAHGTGMQRKRELIEHAVKKGIALTIKNPPAFLASLAELMKKRREQRTMRLTQKEKKKKDDEQKAAKKASEKTEDVDEDERKKQEKQEIDRILTHSD